MQVIYAKKYLIKTHLIKFRIFQDAVPDSI